VPRNLGHSGTHADAPPCPLKGCKTMIAIDQHLLDSGKPDPDSAYWN
jgi:hypothetical protein